MCVLSNRDGFCGSWEDTCFVFLSVYFFIYVHSLYSMCRPHVFLSIWYENLFLYGLYETTLHICNIRHCIIEDNCLCYVNPPGLPPSWQLSVWKEKGPLLDDYILELLYCLGSTVFICREEWICWEQLGSTTYISLKFNRFVWWNPVQTSPKWLQTQPHVCF